MMKIVLSIMVVFVFIGAASAEVTIKAEVDKKSLTTDEAVIYKITATSDEKKALPLQLPKLDGFNVISSAESSTVSYVESNRKTHFVYVFVLAPRAAGTFKIPPAQLKTKDGSMATEAFEIEVKPGEKPIVPQDPSQVTL